MFHEGKSRFVAKTKLSRSVMRVELTMNNLSLNSGTHFVDSANGKLL